MMTKEQFELAKKWLADAPLFIDTAHVERFFDAIASPESRVGAVTVTLAEGDSVKEASESTTGGKLTVKVIEGSHSRKSGREKAETTGKNRAVAFEPIRTPQRQLLALVRHYEDAVSDRAFYIADPTQPEWRDPKTIAHVPRALAFLDLPGEAEARANNRATVKLIPTAAEFNDGKVVPIFDKLGGKDGEKPPKYPEAPSDDGKSVAELRKAYWAWFDQHFSPTRSMLAVEAVAAEHGRIRWIDYRVPVTNDGDTLHLHLQPAGEFDTGVFAYNFIKRGYKHGLRLVGTLKSEPDMDVLAIYNK